MMKKRKVVSLLLAACMFFSIAFCGEITASAVSGSDVVNQAKKYIGTPYSTLDCSQFVSRVFSDLGISLPTAASEYWSNPTRYGTVVGNNSISNAVEGDVISFPGHVEIYSGNGNSIGSRSGGVQGVYERGVLTFIDEKGVHPSYKVIRINGVTNHTHKFDGYVCSCGEFTGVKKEKEIPTDERTYFINVDDVKIRSGPYEGCKLVDSPKKGSVITVTHEVTNGYDNLWYKLDNGKYVYSERVVKAPALTLGIEKAKMKQGDTNRLTGTLNVPSVCSVAAYLDGSKYESSNALRTNGKLNIEDSSFNKKINFTSLSVGEHTVKIALKDDKSGGEITKTIKFTVEKPATNTDTVPKASGTVLVWPVPATNPNTGTTYPGHNNARDIAGGMRGATVVSAIDGKVERKFTCNKTMGEHNGSYDCCHGFGNGLIILGSDGRWYHYAHMQPGSIPSSVVAGGTVEAGQKIGTVGETGMADGPHLHFAISTKNMWYGDTDPIYEKYIRLEDLTPTCSFDVNLNVDGRTEYDGHQSTTFDVYINGERVANDAKDYCRDQRQGSSYEIKDIKITGCYAVAGNSTLIGTINTSPKTTATIYIVTQHSFGDGVVTKEATCTQKGEIVYTCAKCGEKKTEELPLAEHTPVYTERKEPTCTANGASEGAVCSVCGTTITKTEVLPALGHDYVGTFVAATCEEDAKTHYVCSRCGDAYDGEVRDEDKYSFSDWTTERPAAPENGEVEEQTQYKSRTKAFRNGESVSDGWTKESERWIESGSGSVDFAVSWPGGFDQNSDLYRKYNVSRPEATETASTKRTVGAASKIGYLYWHWCRNYNGGPTNRFYSDEYYIDQDGSWTTFHAFFSNEEYEYRTFSGYDPAYVASNASVCRDTYYWTTSRVEINRVDYTDYKKEYTYSKWSDWSDWQFDSAEPGENREVETRTVYRVKTIKDNILPTGAHQWDEGVVTLEPTQAAAGERTYTCKVCGTVKTERIEPQTTEAPTTAAPTTAAPTTAAPTTAAPTTAAPTTAAPTTAPPTTEPPTTTEAPTTEPPHTTVLPHSTEPPAPVTDGPQSKKYLIGDVDFDGKVKASDARLVLRIAAKIDQFTALQLLIADANGDGKVKAGDARKILRATAKIEALDPATIVLTV